MLSQRSLSLSLLKSATPPDPTPLSLFISGSDAQSRCLMLPLPTLACPVVLPRWVVTSRGRTACAVSAGVWTAAMRRKRRPSVGKQVIVRQ